MLKIGILTYHYSFNYGAVLQAYGLYQFLHQQGYNVEFIDYRPQQARKSNWRYLYFRGQRLINPFLLVSGTKKLLKFSKFWQSKLKLSEKTYNSEVELRDASHDYDVVICGSDEIWNISDSMTKFGEETAFFLDFIKRDRSRKISYAASFGHTTEIGESQAKLCSLLQDFDRILVRDSNSAKLVKTCVPDCDKVLDPTFLANFEQILNKPKIERDYVLLYGSFSLEQGKAIESFAKTKNLDIIAIGARPGAWQPPINRIGVSPEEYLGYYSEASFVFTNYFHGVIFAIIFNKPFISFDRPGKSLKVKDLLEDLDFTDQIVYERDVSKADFIAITKMEFDRTKLQQKIARSQKLLLHAIEGQ